MISPIYGALMLAGSSPDFECDSDGLKNALNSLPLSEACPLIANNCESETLNLFYIRHCSLQSAWLFYPLIVTNEK